MVRSLVNFAIISSMAISNNRANIIVEILNVEYGESMISKVIFLKRLIKMSLINNSLGRRFYYLLRRRTLTLMMKGRT